MCFRSGGITNSPDILEENRTAQTVIINFIYLRHYVTTDRLLKSAEMAVNSATTAKGKRVSTQVHRMLVKSKSVGDTKLRMEDRFFLEVHYS